MVREMTSYYGLEDVQYERMCDRRAPPESDRGETAEWLAKSAQAKRLREEHENGHHEELNDPEWQKRNNCPLCEDD